MVEIIRGVGTGSYDMECRKVIAPRFVMANEPPPNNWMQLT
jgi:hypothetical protein